MTQTRLGNSIFRATGRRELSGQRGFTLIELMVVMMIILILLGMAAGNYRYAQLHARESVLKQDLQEMRKAIDHYTLDKQAAPQSLDDLVPNYLHAVPIDPITHAKDWVTVVESVVLTPDQAGSGITDVHSGSDKASPFDNTPYNTW